MEFGSVKYFLLCGLGGILSCGSTHTAIVPLDLVKCRIQVSNSSGRIGYRSPSLYFEFVWVVSFSNFQVNPQKYKGIIQGFGTTVREEGIRALGKGWAPTFVGYSLQGLGKFGCYEIFKIFYSDMLGEVWLYYFSAANFIHVTRCIRSV